MKLEAIARAALLAVCVSVSGAARAALVRTPDTLSVNPTRSTILVVRWQDDAGQRFTTGAGTFCLQFNFFTGCDPATLLGRIPAARDRGINTTPVNSFTDRVAVPTSVANRAIKLLETDPTRGQFFFVRRFTPEGAADLGGGAGVTVFATINLILSGTTGGAGLSLFRVEMFGREPGNPRVRLVKLGDTNLSSGEVVACVEYAGIGRLSGFWEVATPNDPQLREVDLLPEATLTADQRRQRRRFQRVARFIRQLTPVGRSCLSLPYAKLPRDVPGVHQVFLRLDALPDAMAQPGATTGAVASFAMPALQYRVGALLGRVGDRDLAARLMVSRDAAGVRHVVARWTPVRTPPLVVRVSIEPSGLNGIRQVIAPAADGVMDLSGIIPETHAIADHAFVIEALDSDGALYMRTRPVRLTAPDSTR